jgi:hypothetical protein
MFWQAGNVARNLRSPAIRRRSAGGLSAYDRLPEPVRRWVAQAALPWSARSVRGVWARALSAAGGCEAAALARLDRIEARALAREAAAVWGRGYPTVGSVVHDSQKVSRDAASHDSRAGHSAAPALREWGFVMGVS